MVKYKYYDRNGQIVAEVEARQAFDPTTGM